MTFWLDAQLDPELAAWLGSRFHVVAKHLLEVGLLQASDETIHAAARRFGDVVLITKDEDFLDLANRLGAPPQVLLLHCGNMPTTRLQMLLSVRFSAALEELDRGKIVVEIHGP